MKENLLLNNTPFSLNSGNNSLKPSIGYNDVIKEFYKVPKFFSFEYKLPELTESLVQIVEKIIKIDEIEVNYSKGYSKSFQLLNWMNGNEFINAIKNDPEFTESMGKYGEIHIAYPS